MFAVYTGSNPKKEQCHTLAETAMEDLKMWLSVYTANNRKLETGRLYLGARPIHPTHMIVSSSILYISRDFIDTGKTLFPIIQLLFKMKRH